MIKNEDMPELIGQMIDQFEDFLERKGVRLEQQTENLNIDIDTPIIQGEDYNWLSEHLYSIMSSWKICEDSKEELDHFSREKEEIPWYEEAWYEADIEEALEELGIEPSEKAILKSKEILSGIFDDKSDRREMIVEVLGNKF